MRQRLECRALPPMKHRRAYLCPTEIPEVEVALGRLHVRDRPTGHSIRQVQRFRVRGREKRQRVDRLRSALDVNRQQAVVHILRAADGLEEIILEVLVASRQMSGEFNVIRAIDVSLQAVEIVARMMAIDPVELWSFAIK